MKHFIKNDNETILKESRSSRPAVIKSIIYLLFTVGITVFLKTKIWFTEEDLDPVSVYGLMETIAKALIYIMLAGIVFFYISNLGRLLSQKIILTDKRLVYCRTALFPKYEEVPMENIQYCYTDNEDIIAYPNDGDIIIIDNESYLKQYRDIKDASAVCGHVANAIVNKAVSTE